MFCVSIFELKSSSPMDSPDIPSESYSPSSSVEKPIDGPSLLNAQEASSHHGLRTTALHHHHHHHNDDSEEEVEDTIEEPISEHHHHDRTFREERSNIQSDLHPEDLDAGMN